MDDLEVRVGDAEREAVDARLRQAVGAGLLDLPEYEERAGAVWAARTRGQLEAVTRDLPTPTASPPVPPPGRSRRARRVLAVMSGDRLTGPVAPGQGVEAYALMGGAEVDLQRDDLPGHVRVRAVAVMGGIEIHVPRGAEVHLSGLSLMGGRDVQVDPTRAGAPVVQVQAFALMGGVEVRHRKERDAPPAPTRPAASRGLTASSGVTASSAVPSHGSVVVPAAHRPPRHGSRRLAQLGLAALIAGSVYSVAGADAGGVFGSREYVVPASETKVDVRMLFGSVQVVVPDERGATTEGVVVFGSSTCAKACSAPGPNPVRVDGVGAFGSVQILTQSEFNAERDLTGNDDEDAGR